MMKFLQIYFFWINSDYEVLTVGPAAKNQGT